MAMNVGSNSGGEADVMMDINTTPLIDVMLVLIIMLIITIPVQLHAVNLNMPVGKPPPPLVEPVVVTIDIDFDGTISWNGEPVPDRAALEARLSQAAAAGRPAGSAHPARTSSSNTRSVALVLASAQRLGITKLGMVGNEQFVK